MKGEKQGDKWDNKDMGLKLEQRVYIARIGTRPNFLKCY